MDSPANDRRHGERRQNGDALLRRVVAIISIIGALSTIAWYGVPLVGIPHRVEDLEKSRDEIQPAMLYMTCGLYQKAYPDAVPAVCDRAIRRPVSSR
jgi:hypothetical protein